MHRLLRLAQRRQLLPCPLLRRLHRSLVGPDLGRALALGCERGAAQRAVLGAQRIELTLRVAARRPLLRAALRPLAERRRRQQLGARVHGVVEVELVVIGAAQQRWDVHRRVQLR